MRLIPESYFKNLEYVFVLQKMDLNRKRHGNVGQEEL